VLYDCGHVTTSTRESDTYEDPRAVLGTPKRIQCRAEMLMLGCGEE
jgi:hypothetical protein